MVIYGNDIAIIKTVSFFVYGKQYPKVVFFTHLTNYLLLCANLCRKQKTRVLFVGLFYRSEAFTAYIS